MITSLIRSRRKTILNFAFFEPIVWRDDLPEATETTKQLYDAQQLIWENKTAEIRQEIDDLLKPYSDKKWKLIVDKFPLEIQACFYKPVSERTSWDQQMAYLVTRQYYDEGGGVLKDLNKADKEKYEALEKELAAFDEYKPRPLPKLLTVTDFEGDISPTCRPGDSQNDPIEPGFLTVLTEAGVQELTIERLPDSSGRRSALANWIGDPNNPLTSRVIVNRIWQQHFGKGIVSTPSDFGRKGALPTHPELLDWLTMTFVEQGWSFKKLHKLILMSATWQQSAVHPSAADYREVDPSEELDWRWQIRRLDAEQIRDAMLVASGELQNRMGGPSVEADQPRRSLYVKRLRNTPDEFLHSFDVANGLKSVSVRDVTTTPLQSLLMINGEFVLQRATKMAERWKGSDLAADQVVIAVVRSSLGREPTKLELQDALGFLGISAKAPASEIKPEKLIDFCHVLLNSSEFLYLD